MSASTWFFVFVIFWLVSIITLLRFFFFNFELGSNKKLALLGSIAVFCNVSFLGAIISGIVWIVQTLKS